MNPTLEKLRDRLAIEWCRDNQFASEKDRGVSFKDGFDAALKALTESAGEFEEKAATNAAWNELLKHEYLDEDLNKADEQQQNQLEYYQDGARWQHSQDAARIGLAEESGISKEFFEMVCEERDMLEARLAESERKLGQYLDSVCQPCVETSLKLAAAEARVKERDRYKAALEWIAGVNESKPYCTYYERYLDDGTVVPTTREIASEALK